MPIENLNIHQDKRELIKMYVYIVLIFIKLIYFYYENILRNLFSITCQYISQLKLLLSLYVRF